MVVKWCMEKADGELLVRFDFGIFALHFFNELLLCGGDNGLFSIVNITTQKIDKQLQLKHAAIFDIKVWNTKILVAQANGVLSVFNFEFELEQELALSPKSLRKILICGEVFYVAGSEGVIWKIGSDLKIKDKIQAHIQSVFCLDYNFRNHLLLSGGRDAVLKLWQDMKPINVINAHWYHINDIAFNTSQKWAATCSMDKTIKIWEAENLELLKVIDAPKYEAHQSSVNKILWIGINRFISCSDDRTIMCFEIQQ